MGLIIAGLGPAVDVATTTAVSALFELPATTQVDPYLAAREIAARGVAPTTTLANRASLYDTPAGHTFYFGMAGLPQTMLDRNFDYRWEGAKRLGLRVAQQFLGPGEETVSIQGVIYPPRFGSFNQLNELRAEAMSGRPRSFVTGYGEYHGTWCIKSIKDKQGPFWPSGHPRKVEFTIELVHYGSGAGLATGGSFSVSLSPDPTAFAREPLSGSGAAAP